MKRLHCLMVVATLFLAVVTGNAKYTVHSLTGDVSARRAGKVIPVKVDDELRANDEIIIPQGAKIEILNSANSLIFSSVKSGEFSVTQIIIDARMQAEDQRGSIMSKLRISKDDSPEGFMYVESGKVTRALSEYDPAGDSLKVDSRMLGDFVAEALRNIDNDSTANPAFPTGFTTFIASSGSTEGFELTNTLDFPVYFNVIKISGKDGKKVGISELGQPIGSYVLLPNQSITRRQHGGLAPESSHLLVLTHYNFDIDELTNHVEEVINSAAPIVVPDLENPPIFVKAI